MTCSDNAVRPPDPAPIRPVNRWARLAIYLLGAGFVMIAGAFIGMRLAYASPTAVGPTAVTGYTLCASGTGALTYQSSGTCPVGDTTLSVGTQSSVSTLDSEVTSLTSTVSSLQSQVATLKKTLTGVSRTTVNGEQTLRLSGENLQVVNGTGSETTTNGLGNVIVGYNKTPGSQTGSHNLVIGNGQSFTSYGGLLGGEFNAVTAPFGSATGGWYNVVTDPVSSVMGGCDNIAGPGSIPTGPCNTGAESITGGASNSATGTESSVSGGQNNTATGSIASVLGGYVNAASGLGSTVSGGYANTAGANESSVSGGGENTVTGDVASIVGGYFNTATVDEATVLGGCSNVAGGGNVSVNPGCTSFGASFVSVLGGIGNNAISVGSTISGGTGNVANGGQTNSVAGGFHESMTSGAYLTRVGSSTFNS